jgi:L-cysteate sulfo-lyase
MNVRKVNLGTWPTPLEPAPKLSVALGLRRDDLWIKRDDLTGLGGGGNKVRKLEYICGAAIANHAQMLITIGAAQSNHARLTAAAGARLGLDVMLVLSGMAPSTPTGNIALDTLFGAHIRWAGNVDEHELKRIALKYVAQLSRRTIQAEYIPFGGSSVLGAQGYVDCGRELIEQMPELDQVVVAVGSGATMAGLVHALGSEHVYGVDTGATQDPHTRVDDMVGGLGGGDVSPALRIRTDQVGSNYSRLTNPAREALLMAAHSEGIVLDPTYTGRALAGLAAAVRDGTIHPGQRTVFLHSGGMPGLFGHPDWPGAKHF